MPRDEPRFENALAWCFEMSHPDDIYEAIPDFERRQFKAREAHTWVIKANGGTKYRVALICRLYGMTIQTVIERAVICYANALHIHEEMERRFPKEGVQMPRIVKKTSGMYPKLNYPEHEAFFASRKPSSNGEGETDDAVHSPGSPR